MSDIFDAAIKGFTRTKRQWDHRISIKRFWEELPDEPAKREITTAAHEVVKELQSLQDRAPALRDDLEEIIDNFNAVNECETDAEAKEQFNDALDMLYDCGDHMKRIWVG